MKTVLLLIFLVGALAQYSRFKGLHTAVRTEVIKSLVNVGYSVPAAATKEDMKVVKKQAKADGLDLGSVRQAAITVFLDQGVASGTIDADVAANFLAKRAKKQQDHEEAKTNRKDKKDLRGVFRGVKDAVGTALVSALAAAGLITPGATKKQIRAAKVLASGAGVDVSTITEEVIAKYLKIVDPDLSAAFKVKKDAKGVEKQAKQQARKQTRQAEKEAKKAAKKAEKDAKRQARKQAKQDKKAAKKAARQVEKKVKRQAWKQAKKTEKEAKRQARKVEKDAKKQSKVADRLKKKTEGGN